jgi:hypothetical protein
MVDRLSGWVSLVSLILSMPAALLGIFQLDLEPDAS